MSFFPPCYFPPGVSFTPAGPQDAGPDPPIANDGDCLAWLKEQLDQTGLFESVTLGRLASPRPSGREPTASIYPTRWKSTDQVDPTAPARTLGYEILLSIAPDDPTDGLSGLVALDELAGQVVALVNGSTPPGSVGPVSEIQEGRYDERPPKDGTIGLALIGSITYLTE